MHPSMSFDVRATVMWAEIRTENNKINGRKWAYSNI